MIKPRNAVRLMKHLGIVLIAMPEPITTPVGIALSLTAHFLSKRIEAHLYDRLRRTFQNYLAHSKPKSKSKAQSAERKGETEPLSTFQQSQQEMADYAASQAAMAKWRFPHKGTITGAETAFSQPDPKAKYVPLVWIDGHDTAPKTVHHTVDWKRLSPHYGTITGSKFAPGQSEPEAVPARVAKIVHHDIDMRELSRLFSSADSGEATVGSAATPEKVVVRHSFSTEFLARRFETEEPAPPSKHHAIDIASLRQRYGVAALR